MKPFLVPRIFFLLTDNQTESSFYSPSASPRSESNTSYPGHLNWLDSPLFTADEHNYVKSCTQNRKNSSICIVIWKQIINFAPSIHYERRNWRKAGISADLRKLIASSSPYLKRQGRRFATISVEYKKESRTGNCSRNWMEQKSGNSGRSSTK